MKYRTEIDGLRALAVVPVILFHAGFELFSGGFVGVDVFFVISGYLITTIIIEDIDNKRFSIVNFYERRARRILPALFFVMLVCIPFAWVWMLPVQMKDFSQSLIAVSFFASNILFWRESGYFDAAAEEKPLLHTWSLAVEEQYYVLFPIFLILAWRFGKNKVFWMIVLMAAISLLLSEWGWRNRATANFYLAPTRVWELFSGSICAFIVQKYGIRKNNPLSLLGLVAIIFSIFAYDKSTPFPSVYALVPVLGVVLIVLFADKETLVARILSTKFLVVVGLISFSAYLWHQPLFAFARLRLLDAPSEVLMGILSILSLFLALLSWKYIEKPFRYRNEVGGTLKRSKVYVYSFFGLAIFIVIGTLGELSNGYDGRKKFDVINSYQMILNQKGSGFAICRSRKINIDGLKGDICQIGSSDVTPQGVLWGDSYAGSALFGIDALLKQQGLSYIAVLSNGCPPVPGISREVNVFDCTYDRHQDVMDWFSSQDELEELIWIGKFRSLNGTLFDRGYFLDLMKPDINVLQDRIRSIAEKLKSDGKRIVFVQEGPYFSRNIPEYLSKTILLSESVDKKVLVADVDEQRKNLVITSQYLNSIEGIEFVDSIELFCEKDVCNAVMKSGDILVVDRDHLSEPASMVLAQNIFSKLGR